MQIGQKFSPCCSIALHLTSLFLMPSPLQPLLPGIINYSYVISSILVPLKRPLAEEMTDLGWFGSVNFPVLYVSIIFQQVHLGRGVGEKVELCNAS